MSTGGAAMKAMMNTEVAVNRVGIIRTPNHPMYKRFSVLVIQAQKRDQRFALSRLSKVAVMGFLFKVFIFQARRDAINSIKDAEVTHKVCRQRTIDGTL
jgi:hypothetical protein